MNRSAAAAQLNFKRKCWRCLSTYRTRYKRRSTGLCQACLRTTSNKKHNAKRGYEKPARELYDIEYQGLEVDRIHSTCYGPSGYGSSINLWLLY